MWIGTVGWLGSCAAAWQSLEARASNPEGIPISSPDRDCRIYDIRIVDRDDRFLALLGELTLVGWTADRGLIVLTPLSRPYRISPHELDSVLGLS